MPHKQDNKGPGKGSRNRTHNHAAYAANYDRIFRSNKDAQTSTKQ